MKYTFTTKAYGQEGIFGVLYESISDTEKALFEINSYIWTPLEAQHLIDQSNALQNDDELEYQVEGGNLYIVINKAEVCFFNLLSKKKEPDFKWKFNDFITFIEDFKKFIEKNS